MRYFKASIPIVLLSVVPVPLFGQPATNDNRVAGRMVHTKLVKAATLEVEAWPAETPSSRLETVVAVFRNNDRVPRMLQANGIRPDTEAYTLVYDLNPSIVKLSNIPLGTRIVLPKINGGPRLRQKLENGYIVMLTVDKDLKEEFKRDVERLREMLPAFSNLDSTHFENVGARNATISFAQETITWLDHIRNTFGQRTAPPLRSETLSQIANECEALKTLLEKTQIAETRFSTADQEQIRLIHEDIRMEIEKWDNVMAGALPEGEPQIKVIVTIRGNNQNLINNLRVYCIVNGAFRNPPVNPPVRSRSFDSLGSGAWKMLPIKNYKIWAARDGDPGHPLTAVVDLEVRQPSSGNELSKELSLLP